MTNEDFITNKLKIQQLIDQNKFNEALMVIDDLEKNTSDIDSVDHLPYWFFKCHLLAKTGKSEKGLKIADKSLSMVRDQIPGNLLLLVDAIITKIETLRLAVRFSSTYSIDKLSGYLHLIEEGERTLESISIIEPLERTERIAILQRNKGIIYRSLGDLGRSEKCFQQSLVINKKMGKKKDTLEVLVDLANVFGIKAEFNPQLEIFQNCLNLCKTLEDREGIAENFLNIARVYQRKEESETASKYVKKSLQLINELPKTNRVARLLYNIGVFYLNERYESSAALDAYQRSLSIWEELDNKDEIHLCLHILGDMYQYSKGDLNRALDYYEKSIAMFEEDDEKIVHCWNLLDVGNLYHLKGNLDLALSYFQEALPLLEEIGNDFYFCQTFLHIGRVYRSKGDNSTALDYYKRCLKLLEERKLRFGAETEGLTYYELIALMVNIKNMNNAKKYFELFTQYYEKNEQSHRFLNQWFKLSEALILKNSIRIKDKARAQQLFQEVINDPTSVFNLLNYLADSKKTAMLNLCEILLFELKSSPDEITDNIEVFQEVKQLLNNLASLAKQQHSYPLLGDVTILQAKLALIEGNLSKVMQLLAQAKTIAEENELEFLHRRINIEENLLKNQLKTWENLIKKNAPLSERLAQAQVEEYIVEAKKMVNLSYQSSTP